MTIITQNLKKEREGEREKKTNIIDITNLCTNKMQ
jgi:hypothetical protein